jgi:hypothetical protein
MHGITSVVWILRVVDIEVSEVFKIMWIMYRTFVRDTGSVIECRVTVRTPHLWTTVNTMNAGGTVRARFCGG